MTVEAPRMTRSRRAIVDELRMNRCHPSADEIHERLRERLPRISLGTVYRNLEYLSRHGLARVLREPGGRRRYDVADDEHCHLWCTSCGEVRDVRLVPSVCVEGLIEDDFGYRMGGHGLSFLGTCPTCSERLSPRNEHGRSDGAQGFEDREESAHGICGRVTGAEPLHVLREQGE